jgi:23S rRNA G2445 N2-methylase RlmL
MYDFMLSNPPYGKSWKSDLERMGSKIGIKDQRFLYSIRARSFRSSPAQVTVSCFIYLGAHQPQAGELQRSRAAH